MPRTAPCRSCGRTLHVGPTSLAEPMCQPCRRAAPSRRTRTSPVACTSCRRTYRPRVHRDIAVCATCRSAARRYPPGGRSSAMPAPVKRRRAAQANLDRATAGTRSLNGWIAGPCAWCGGTFIDHASAPSHWCSNRCRWRAKKQRRATRQHGGTGWRWSDFMRIARTFDYCCAYCGTRPDRLDPDHVIPLARGGDDSLTNLLPACPPCNHDKRDLLLDEWATDRARRGLPARNTTTDYHHLALPAVERAHTAAA